MKIRVLTVKQPWAHLIIHGYRTVTGRIEHKRIENRSRFTSYRGELYIHAGLSFDREAIGYIGDFCPEAAASIKGEMARINAGRGKIIGRVQLTGCQCPEWDDMPESCWAEVGAWHWMLNKPEAVVPFSARGQLGIWTMDAPPLIETEYFPKAGR